jgi:ATP-dependent DNA helicase RecQ
VLASLRPPRVLACTATATPIVRDEILARLGLDPASTAVVLRGFARPNLHLACLELDKRRDQRLAVQEALRVSLGRRGAARGGAIVYASTRKRAERLASEIERAGYCAAVYHAGLDPRERHEVSERFASGELEVVAATNAFGMGIDRADIRAVVHAQAPGSIEAYYQEVGRAGRDGRPAAGVLLTSAADFGLRRRLIESSAGEPARVERQWKLFLDLMRYVEAGSCRHDFILRYFGDEQEVLGGCGHCDVCNRLGAAAAGVAPPGMSADDAIVVRKALAGVARARARVGMRGVADMLAGRESELLKRQGLDRLSTFGILGDRSPGFALALLRRLVTAGLVDVSAGDYPMPRLTPTGVRVMKDEAPVRVLLPPEPREPLGPGPRPRRSRTATPDPAPAPASRTAQAFEALRKTRRRLASERGVPAYVVCHDTTLLAIAERLPRTRAELHDVPGMGPKRVDAYGDAFLEALGEAEARPP